MTVLFDEYDRENWAISGKLHSIKFGNGHGKNGTDWNALQNYIAKIIFSWKEFIYSHNGELLGDYGNFVNRTLKFIEKSFAGVLPHKDISMNLQDKVNRLYKEVGHCIETTAFKQGSEKVFELVRFSNKYFDEQQPWKQVKEDHESC